jgi:hypothetical protein
MKYQEDGYSRFARMNVEKFKDGKIKDEYRASLTSYLRKKMLPQEQGIQGVEDSWKT